MYENKYVYFFYLEPIIPFVFIFSSSLFISFNHFLLFLSIHSTSIVNM